MTEGSYPMETTKKESWESLQSEMKGSRLFEMEGFDREKKLISRINAFLDADEFRGNPLLKPFRQFVLEYSSLMNNLIKITRISDSTQARLLRVQSDLSRAEERYRSVYVHAYEGLFQMTPERQLLMANPAFLRLFGFDALIDLKNATGNDILSLFLNIEDFSRTMLELEKIHQKNEVIFQMLRKDGSLFWASINLRVVPEVKHGFLIEGSIIDVTARLETEDSLRRAIKAAENANAAKTNLIANVTHELRTPLNGILGYAQILGDFEAIDPRIASPVQVIRENAVHLMGLINELLDASRIEAGKMEAVKLPFAIRPLIEGISEQFSVRARQKNLEFRLFIDPLLCSTYEGDEHRLRQVIFNLLGNAVKFTEHGGISFRILALRENGVQFDIIDSGPGISPEDQERIFLPFEQAGDPHIRRSGTGLGLSICRSLTHLMGGMLTLESTVGKGSRFSLRLPLKPIDSETEVPPEHLDPNADLRPETPSCEASPDAVAVFPDRLLLEELIRLAASGRTKDILAGLTRLSDSDARMMAFCESCATLAKAYRMRDLRLFLKEALQSCTLEKSA